MTYTSQVDMESKVLTLELNDSCEVDLSTPQWYSSIFGSTSVLKTDKKVAEFMKKFWPNTDFLYEANRNVETKVLDFHVEEKVVKKTENGRTMCDKKYLNLNFDSVLHHFFYSRNKSCMLNDHTYTGSLIKLINGSKMIYKKEDGKFQNTHTVFKGDMPHTDNTTRYRITHPYTHAVIQLILVGDGPFKVGNKDDFSPQAKQYFSLPYYTSLHEDCDITTTCCGETLYLFNWRWAF